MSPDGNDVFVTDGANHRVQKFSYDAPTAIRTAPASLSLTSHPNPFNAETTIEYGGASGVIRIAIYDVQGHHVRTLLDGTSDARSAAVSWDGTTNHGTQVPAGVYFVRLQSSSGEVTRRMVLLR